MKPKDRDATIEEIANDIADTMLSIRDELVARKKQNLYVLLNADNRRKCKRIDNSLYSLIQSRLELGG